MNNYETVTEAVSDLAIRGYTESLTRYEGSECLICTSTSICVTPDYFRIDEIYRFEGLTDPGDQMIVFAISSAELAIKAVVVNGYGMYGDTQTARMVQDLKNKTQ